MANFLIKLENAKRKINMVNRLILQKTNSSVPILQLLLRCRSLSFLGVKITLFVYGGAYSIMVLHFSDVL